MRHHDVYASFCSNFMMHAQSSWPLRPGLPCVGAGTPTSDRLSASATSGAARGAGWTAARGAACAAARGAGCGAAFGAARGAGLRWPLNILKVAWRLSSLRTNRRFSIWATFHPPISSPTRTRRTSFFDPDWTIARASSASMTMPTNVTLGGSGGGGGGLTIGGGGGAGTRRLGENSGRSRVAERRSSECTASGLARPAVGVAGA
jgi:hypothetical protein